MFIAKYRRKLINVGCAIAGLIGTIGVLHTPLARPLLMKIGGCPVGRASAADVDFLRRQSVAAMRGSATEVAPARPALGFSLERTTARDIRAWAKANHLSCTDRREGMLIMCSDVSTELFDSRRCATGHPDGRGARIDEVTFAFRPRDQTLVNVTTMSYGFAPNDAVATMGCITERLDADLGAQADQHRDGEMTAARLSQGGYATSMTSYRFRDYVAEVSATSFDNGSRVVVREHYVSAN